MPVGVHRNDHKLFSRKTYQLNKDDYIYMASDGFADQFGGKRNRKYLKANLRKLLVKIHEEPADKQKQLLKTEFDEWKGNSDQIDDVLVAGIKV